MTPLDARVADAHDALDHAIRMLWQAQADVLDSTARRDAPCAAIDAASISVSRDAIDAARAELDDALDARRAAAEAA